MATREREVVAPDAGDEFKLVLDTARSAIVQEFQIAERLDAKARGQMAVAGVWFAIVQTFAGLTLKAQLDAGTENSFGFTLVVTLAVVSAGCLVVATWRSYQVWRLRPESEVNAEGLGEMAADAKDPTVAVAEKLVDHYARILTSRRASNLRRVESFKASVRWWFASMVLGLLEIVVALFTLAAS